MGERLSSPALISSTPLPSPILKTAPTRRDDARWAAVVALVFFCIVGVVMVAHEMWRDEWQTWMLARDSGSLLELLQNLRYEGHPAGWYLLLYGLSRFTREAAAMQLLHLFVATGSVYLLARYAPFSRPFRVLIAFGYFFAYEYAVISRSYSLGVLGLFAFCALYPWRRRHPILLTLTLLVLAAGSIYGVIIALAAGVTLAAEIITVRVRHRTLKLPRPSVAIGGIAVAVGIGAVVLLLLPPIDAIFVGSPSNTVPGLARQDLLPLIRVWESYVPIPDITDTRLWDRNFISRSSVPVVIVLLALSVSLLGAAILVFLRKPFVLLFYVLATTGLLLFSHLVHAGYLRHDGHLFVVFVASLWLCALRSPEWRLPGPLRRLTALDSRPVRGFLLALFGAQLLGAAALYSADLRGPFTPAEELARFLRAEGLDAHPIVVSRPPEGSPVAGILDRPVYYLDASSDWTFVRWGRLGALPPNERRMEILRSFMESAGPEVIVILSYTLDLWPADFQVDELARFDLAQAPWEEYYVYRVTRVVAPPPEAS